MVESATGSALVEFVTSPYGVIIVGGLALAAGVFYAWRQTGGYSPEESTDVEDHRRQVVERFGNKDNRSLMRNGAVVASLRNYEKADDLGMTKKGKWMAGDGGDAEDVELTGSVRMVGTRPRFLDEKLAKIPVLGRLFRDVYVVSQDSVIREGPQSVVLDDDCPLEKVADIYMDMSPDSMADVLHIHGLAMFEANQAQNEEYIKAANWRNPVSQELQKIAEEFQQRSSMYNERENSEVG